MNTEFTLKDYPGVLIAGLTAVGIWLCSQLGVLSLGEGWLYDITVSGAGTGQADQAHVLLLSASDEDLSLASDGWLALVDELDRLGARQIGFSFFPRNADNTFYTRAAASNKVVFARPLRHDNEGDKVIAAWPQAVAGQEPPFGVMLAPQAEGGIYRRAASSIQLNEIRYPSFIAALAGKNAAPAAPNFLIDFRSEPATLPQVSIQRALNHGLIEELVRERLVLIGYERHLADPGLATPQHESGSGISALEYRGYALSTLSRGSPILELNSGLLLGLLLTLSFVILITYHWLSLRASLWVSGFSLLGYFLVGLFVLREFNFRLPAFTLMLNHALVFGLISRQRLALEGRELKRMLVETSARLRERLFPPDFYDTPEHWAQLITFVDQSLELKRLLFLERIEGDHRVREIKALRCSLQDIDERRRDYERTPYSTAIAQGGPVRVTGMYLKRADEQEEQYIVPLIYAGEVKGFWAFGVDPDVAKENERFEQTVQEFAAQIGELLYHRHQWHEQQASNAQYFKRLARLDSGEMVYRDVRDSMRLLEVRMDVLEGLFDGIHLATVLYDLFGRVVQVNREMSELLKLANWPVYDLTALDLLTRMTTLDDGQVRELIRRVVVEHRDVTLPVTLDHVDGREFVLHLCALERKGQAMAARSEAAPFKVMGILFELIDVTPLKAASRMKDSLVQRLNYQIRNDMESILLAAQLLGMHLQDPQRQHDTIRLLTKKVEGLSDVLVETLSHLGKEMDASVLKVYPVDGRQPLLEVIDTLKPEAAQRRVSFDADIPRLLSLVMATQEQLHFVLDQILQALLHDAASDTTITISVVERDGWMTYKFRNTGFGMPNERFQAYLFERQSEVASDYLKLREAVSSVEGWDGEFLAQSEVGTGIELVLRLRAFI